jgi:hypothetical protein
MSPTELGEYLFGGPHPTIGDVVVALPEGFINIGAGSDIEQSLIGFSVLHDSLGFAVDGQHYRPLALLELLEELG